MRRVIGRNKGCIVWRCSCCVSRLSRARVRVPYFYGNNIDVVQCIVCHVERSEPLGRWPKGKANISQMSLAKSQRGILPTLRFVRMTLIAVQFVFLDNCYIISIILLQACNKKIAERLFRKRTKRIFFVYKEKKYSLYIDFSPSIYRKSQPITRAIGGLYDKETERAIPLLGIALF